MKPTAYKPQYRRNLPHYQPQGATLFITMRLAGSLPKYIIDRLQNDLDTRRTEISKLSNEPEQKRLLQEIRKTYFRKFDTHLDQAGYGPTWLSTPELAALVYESLCYRDGRIYILDTFTIMPNHVHILFRPNNDEQGDPIALSSIMMSLKRHTARECNKILQRKGQFWQHESYDHVIRDQSAWERVVKYILNNPLNAGLVEKWEDWPWSYLREEPS